jgi:hypothetical protein
MHLSILIYARSLSTASERRLHSQSLQVYQYVAKLCAGNRSVGSRRDEDPDGVHPKVDEVAHDPVGGQLQQVDAWRRSKGGWISSLHYCYTSYYTASVIKVTFVLIVTGCDCIAFHSGDVVHSQFGWLEVGGLNLLVCGLEHVEHLLQVKVCDRLFGVIILCTQEHTSW